MRLAFSPRAARDLEEIGDYIARDNLSRACSFIDEIQGHCNRIAEMPSAFVSRDDLTPGICMAVHKSYLILFRVLDGIVSIERIVHGARRISELL